MCNNCMEQILNKRHAIRHATLSVTNFKHAVRRSVFQATNVYRSNFDEYEDNIQKILLKTLSWKKRKQSSQSAEIIIQNSLFFRVANSLKTDQDRQTERNKFEASQISFEENQELLDDQTHKSILETLTSINEEDYRTLEDALSYCENEFERDTLLSLANGEKAEVFAERHQITLANANQKRRRVKEKIKVRIRDQSPNIDEMGDNYG